MIRMGKKTNLKAWVLISAVSVVVLSGSVLAANSYDNVDGRVRADRDFGKMPLYSIENQGELSKDVGFFEEDYHV